MVMTRREKTLFLFLAERRVVVLGFFPSALAFYVDYREQQVGKSVSTTSGHQDQKRTVQDE